MKTAWPCGMPVCWASHQSVWRPTPAVVRYGEKTCACKMPDLLTEYNLFECDLARPKVKAADFSKEAHLKCEA